MNENYPRLRVPKLFPKLLRKTIPLATSLMTLALFFFGLQVLTAQKIQKFPGETVVCPAGPDNEFTRVNIPKQSSADYQRTLENAATSQFEITFGPGAQANPPSMEAFQYALDIWATQIVSAIPIKIFADFADLGAGVLASAGPSYNVTNFDGAPQQDVLYPAALANALAGEVLFPDENYDLVVNLGNGINWYFGTDGNTPAGQYDFVTVALHEAGHGLGFTTVRSYNYGTGSLRSGGNPSIFGVFIIDGDGNLLLDLPDPSTELGDAFTGGDIYMGGTFAVAALGGTAPELYAPPTWQGGSSLAHWDEGAFPAGDPNSLMTPQVGAAESNFDIGNITRGLFKDMGWVINDDDAPPLVLTPKQINEELFVGDTLVRTVSVSSLSDESLSITVSPSAGSATITSVSPSSFTLASAETASFDINIATEGLNKGVYNDTVFVNADGLENPLAIPVNILVLDGTEVPLIAVNPDSFNETIEQLQIVNRDLVIENSGDADLAYSIEVKSDSMPDFDSRVRNSAQNIRTSGFKTKAFGTISNAMGKAALVTNEKTYENVISTVYATDFEEFTPGIVNGQQGWVSQYESNWIITTENPAQGLQHFRGVSDGLGDMRPGSILAISPTIIPGDEPFMVASASINIQGEGVTWEFIPQSPSAESVNTRLRFNPDRTIDVLSTSDYVRLDTTTPEGYFDLRIVVDKADNSFKLFFDNNLIFSGLGFAPEIEQVILLSNMEVEGSTFDMDDLEVTDGDPSAFFLSVAPSAGIVPRGESRTLNVKFDGRTTEPGEYQASIGISSNDVTDSLITVPVSLTVLKPPTITVAPDSLSASVNVITDAPAIKTETFTVSNSGESALEFSASSGKINFTPPTDSSATALKDLDMSRYGVGNTGTFRLERASKTEQLKKIKNVRRDAVTYTDSIAYDSGLAFPDDFGGFSSGAPLTSAMKFDVESDFTLSAIRNGYRTEAVADPVIILEIYKGGDTPNDGELLLTQTFNEASPDGIVVAQTLSEALKFGAGDSFWVVYKYPEGITFPQGIDAEADIRPDTYFASSDGGATYSAAPLVFFTRALSGGAGNYITLEPSSGTVAPGESTEVTVTFDGTSIANGIYNTPIIVASNDPVTPQATVATTFEVSGQVSEVALSEEFLLFNNVFLGAEEQLSFTISNNGLSQLNVSSIASDNEDFSVDVDQATIAAGDSQDVQVTFKPSVTGNSNGLITINSDAPNMQQLEIVVNGVGVDPPVAVLDPAEVFAAADAGTSVEASISLNNTGNAPLIFSFPDIAVATALADPNVKLNVTEMIDFGDANNLKKDGQDLRVGHPVEYSVGTDDVFGYTWIDSDEEGGPVYSFNDISASGTNITADVGGDGTTSVELPFIFEFYGESYDDLLINANGFVAFQQPTGFTFGNRQIPADDAVNGMIAGLWDDLEPQEFEGSVTYEAFEDRFIVQWTNASIFRGSADQTVTFQIVLNSSGNIDIYYADVETAPFLNSTTVGIENPAGTDGAQVAFNTDYIKDSLAIRFVKPDIAITEFITEVMPMSGVVPAGGSKQLKVTLDATELNDGVYYDKLEVSSNDPIGAQSTSLFELTVTGFPQITATPDTLDFGPVFVGVEREATFLIQNTGSKVLNINGMSNENPDFVLDTVAPISLRPEQSLLVGVTFAPSSFGPISDVISITSDDAFDNATFEVQLMGVGVDPPVVGVTPDSLALTVNKGSSVEEDITISNTGGSVLNYFVSPPYFGKAGQDNAQAATYQKLNYAKIRSKEEADTRKGPKFLNASGGPGTFGYSWIDSNSGGPAYAYMDISTTGTRADVGGDGNETVALPFEFNLFGITKDSVTIAANGFLTFAPIVGSNFANAQIPNPAEPNFLIAALWDDLQPQNGEGVFYESTEDAFIVQYEAVPGFGFPPFLPIPAPVSFQVILFKDGSIKMQYENVDSSIATSSTVGLEGPDGTSGLQVVFNAEYLTNELAITFTPPLRGSLEAGESVDVPITFSAEDLEGGQTYTGVVAVGSNDPVTPLVNVPVSLEVIDVVEVTGLTLFNADLNEEIGPLMEGDVINLDNYPENSFSVVANTGDMKVGSVVFGFNGNDRYKVENNPAFSLNGNKGMIFMPVEFPLGANTITATPYTGKDGKGMAGIPITVNFEVTSADPITCFGESVVSYNPGNKKDGRPLPPSRSNPDKALGLPLENDNYNFVALGFGGSITIELSCEIKDMEGNDLLIVETGFNDVGQPCETYPEKAMIEASLDGENFVVIAQELCRDGEVDLAQGGLSSAKYIRVTDISNPADFVDGSADGYDLDAILVINNLSDEDLDILLSTEDNFNRIANSEMDITLYPNPVSDYVSLAVQGNGGTFTSQLISISGAVIDSRKVDLNSGVNPQVIDMTNVAQGFYILQLTDEEGAINSKLRVLKK